MSRPQEWLKNLLHIFAPHHDASGVVARVDKKEEDKKQKEGGGKGEGSGGYKIVNSLTKPTPFNDPTSGRF